MQYISENGYNYDTFPYQVTIDAQVPSKSSLKTTKSASSQNDDVYKKARRITFNLTPGKKFMNFLPWMKLKNKCINTKNIYVDVMFIWCHLRFLTILRLPASCLELGSRHSFVTARDEDPVLAKNRIWGSVHLKLREIFKSLLNEYFRSFRSYLWCQTFPVSPKAPDPVRIWPDPGWFSEFSPSMIRLTPTVWKQKKKAFKII